MKTTNFNIDELVESFDNRKIANVPGYKFFPYAVEILALRQLGLKHRLIADMLNRKVKPEKPLNNQSLSNLVSRWKSSGLLLGLDIEVASLAQTIQAESEARRNRGEASPLVVEQNHAYDPFREVDSVERHNIVEFLKRLEKKSESILSENEKTVAKDYFKTVDKQSDFENAVDKCLTIIKGSMA